MIIVEYARTKSVDYQSQRYGVQFSLPDGFTLAAGMELARFVVDFELDGSYRSQKQVKQLATIYEACFSGSITEYIESKE